MAHPGSVLEQGVALGPAIVPQANGLPPNEGDDAVRLTAWANKYRGATVADLDLPPALSTSPNTSLADAMLSASSHDYSFLSKLSSPSKPVSANPDFCPDKTASRFILLAMSSGSSDYTKSDSDERAAVLSDNTRSLLGYLSVAKLKQLFESGHLQPSDPVSKAMVKFQRSSGSKYQVITMETELYELEGFFENVGPFATASKQDFAVVTDGGRKFVLGVVTRSDLEEFVKRRPA
jgi:hypothetical protein